MSSSLGPVGRQSYKRCRTRQSKRAINITIDLNSPAPGADDMNVASSSRSFQHVQSNQFPIYVDDADDDVQMLSASAFSRFTAPPQEPMPAPIAPIAPIVVLDDEEEIIPGPSGVAREERNMTINLDLSLDLESFASVRKKAPNRTLNMISIDSPRAPLIQMEPPPPPPKEITFSCPVCMSTLVEPSSTICGHIFCKECIRASIQAQKRCPTCRKHLNMKNFHRVYLPSTE